MGTTPTTAKHPLRHISIRVPWHDNRWTGCVCRAPHYNEACLILPLIAETREDKRELVTVADTEEHEGRKTAWTPILNGEIARAQGIRDESVGLKFRAVQCAVVATFLHSQPVGQSAKTRDLTVLAGPTRPDKIELEKGLLRWSQASRWLDDLFAPEGDHLPSTWRLGNRPNLNQMHSVASKNISDDLVRARLVDEIPRVKKLTAGASASGVHVHTLPLKPSDVKDFSTVKQGNNDEPNECGRGGTICLG